MSDQPNKTQWTDDAKSRIMSSEAKSGNDAKFSKHAQSETDKNPANKTQSNNQGQQKK
ncbi:hypothetical protein FPOAC2_09493 [Fusarium poae]|uniref:hypothetical protein n=1 Tax=Fusarium poae TaxID=36050 RepID=UPI001CE803DA|nr:hypothetical protein FPOAC1_009554 [Fusarium poae]KAG8670150.1 hypothetical protein FPOAC1_009554 [Fusarium poae]